MPTPAVEISVVVPVHDESANVVALLDEIEAALAGRLRFEAVFVDDASGDDTRTVLQAYARSHPWLAVLAHRHNCGQSAAVLTGVRGARAALVATLDGDGQNAPADIPALVDRWRDLAREHPGRPLLVAGWRKRRHDTGLRRLSSRIANGVRARLLGDATPDTGCGLKVFAREDFLALPWFDHLHRFLPALVQRAGGVVTSVPVAHRPRQAGRSHYGVHNRLWVGLVDLLGVMWLQRRARVPVVERLTPAAAPATPATPPPPAPPQGEQT
ncbi:MAG: glycosyltransferase [Burkholderiales bacterium]|nr:glycosyltransferase [Burkholderiales bacterium]